MNAQNRGHVNQINDEIDLYELFLNVKKNLFKILIVALAFGIIAGIYTQYFVKPLYKSTAKIYVRANSETMVSISDLQIGSALALDYEEMIKSRPIQEKVIENLKLNMSYGQLLNNLTLENPEKTRIIKITVSNTDPELAMKIANELAKVSSAEIAEVMNSDEPAMVESAIKAKAPYSPSKTKNIALAVILAVILCVGVILIRQMMDNTLYTPEDVEKYLGMNTLAVIPDGEVTEKNKKVKKEKSDSKDKK